MNQYAAYLGIDWADKKHDVCLQSAGCEKSEHQILKHTPEAILTVRAQGYMASPDLLPANLAPGESPGANHAGGTA